VGQRYPDNPSHSGGGRFSYLSICRCQPDEGNKIHRPGKHRQTHVG